MLCFILLVNVERSKKKNNSFIACIFFLIIIIIIIISLSLFSFCTRSAFTFMRVFFFFFSNINIMKFTLPVEL